MACLLMAERVLILDPHTDDGVFGCGGFISRFAEGCKEIYQVAFSSARKSVPEGLPKDILREEVKEAAKVLGVDGNHLILLDYPVRDFPEQRQNILEDMIRLKREIEPDIVLLPSTNDTHQDHQVVAQEGFRAFKEISIVGYEMPYNNLAFTTNLFAALKQRHLAAKLAALTCYKSQSHKGKSYATDDAIKGLARVRGCQIGVEYAEAFEVIRWVV